MTHKTKKQYVSPQVRVLELNGESILAMSGQGTDTTGDHDFGGRNTDKRAGWSSDDFGTGDGIWKHDWE